MAPTQDYKILLAPTSTVLEEKVKEALSQGYQVYGGLVVYGNAFAQAVVKTEDLMAQMLTQLKSVVSNTSTIASNTTAIKNSTASIDEKTPEA